MDHPYVATSCIIQNEEGKILLMQRAEDDLAYPNHWAFVGGFIDWGEKAEEAIVREVKEEIGVEAEVVKFTGKFYNTPHPTRGIVISLPFYVKIVSGEPHAAQPEEVKDVRWFTPEEIRGMELGFDHKQKLQDEGLI